MNEEQSKRLADAAEAVISAADALEDARAALDDAKFNSEQERERMQAAQQAASRLDSAGKKLEDALRKGAVASVSAGRLGMFARYQGAAAAAREARATAKASTEQDGTQAKRSKGQEALAQLDMALVTAAALVFGEA
ncbi:MAG TPA: hypothetical protein VFK32_09610 [Tepidiformaceae bacterium]|nr:hypothetical protein [Tepidiformaceae bacterium]